MPDNESANKGSGANKDTEPSNEGTSGKDNSSASSNKDNDPGKLDFHTVYRWETMYVSEHEVRQIPEADEDDSGTPEDES